MFLVFFSVLSLKMFLTCSYFPNEKILSRGAYLQEIRIVLYYYFFHALSVSLFKHGLKFRMRIPLSISRFYF